MRTADWLILGGSLLVVLYLLSQKVQSSYEIPEFSARRETIL